MSEPLTLAFDEHVDSAINRALERAGIVVITVQAAGRRQGADPAQLRWAADNGLVFVTQDHDFDHLHKLNQNHAGIVMINAFTSLRQSIEWLELIARASSPEDMRGQLVYIPRRP